jgi:septum site-determining protein MinC
MLGLCSKYGLKPMAFKGGTAHFQDAIKATGLIHLPAASLKSVVEQETKPQPTSKADPKTEVKTVVEEKPIACRSMFITQPVRSGQQIYAKQTDLIIMSNVSEGAEVLADGHIHVYGALRGRALAGAQGDESARIFSRSMEAELLSIAGNFILNEEIRARIWKESAQVYFKDNVLHLKSL